MTLVTRSTKRFKTHTISTKADMQYDAQSQFSRTDWQLHRRHEVI